MDTKFNLDEIEKTFTSYKKGQMFDGVVVAKKDDGVVFNIGGKNDAFIPVDDFDDYDDIKIGERFKVIITKSKNEDGVIEASRRAAINQSIGTLNAEKLKLGSRFTFVPTKADHGLKSKMGIYSIFIPISEVSSHYVHDLNAYIGKQQRAVVTEIDRDGKEIIASIKLLDEQEKEQTETMFWSSIFINKIVTGKVKKIVPYGAFVNVDGVDCFVHISNLSHQHIDSPSEVLKEGDELNFKVIELDRDNKKVALGLKQLMISPKEKAFNEIQLNGIYQGQVIKILAFGAIIELENKATGLLHISNATDKNDKKIYEIVKLNDKVEVEVISKEDAGQKIGFRLIKKL